MWWMMIVVKVLVINEHNFIHASFQYLKKPDDTPDDDGDGEVLHHSSAAEAAVTAGLETLSREGHRALSLRPYGSSFVEVVRASNFPKMNVGHGSEEQGCRGGDPKEMAQLTDDKR